MKVSTKTRQEETMEISNIKNKKIGYVLIKIGNSWYSTTMGADANCRATLSDTDTKNIGKEKSLRTTGELTEGNAHRKLPIPIPFEVTLYFKDEDLPEDVQNIPKFIEEKNQKLT